MTKYGDDSSLEHLDFPSPETIELDNGAQGLLIDLTPQKIAFIETFGDHLLAFESVHNVANPLEEDAYDEYVEALGGLLKQRPIDTGLDQDDIIQASRIPYFIVGCIFYGLPSEYSLRGRFLGTALHPHYKPSSGIEAEPDILLPVSLNAIVDKIALVTPDGELDSEQFSDKVASIPFHGLSIIKKVITLDT